VMPVQTTLTTLNFDAEIYSNIISLCVFLLESNILEGIMRAHMEAPLR
jgi:hypothetical protein